MPLQQVNLYNLQEQIQYGISWSSRPEVFRKKAAQNLGLQLY